MKFARFAVAAFLAFAPALSFAQQPVPVTVPIAQQQTQAQVGWDKTAPLTATVVAPQTAVIDTGTIAGQTLTWVITTFGGIIGTILSGILIKVLQKSGVDLSEAQRDKLQGIIVNGLNLGAAKAETELQGKGQIEIKNAAVASAVTYVQQHGADTLTALGLDPTSDAAVEAIKARIETAIADDNTPTHPALDPTPAAPKAA